MTEEPKLPRKPSALIRLALRDLRAVEADPRYRVDMGKCHEPYNGVCYVGLAGAVMAVTLKAESSRAVYPTTYPPYAAALDAIAWLRCVGGCESSAAVRVMCDLIGATPIAWPARSDRYEDDPEGFRAVLGRLADAFEVSGQ